MTPKLAHVPVSHLSETPKKWMLFLHGILGSKSNWRTIARKLVAARPEWGALLVDLREHGQSQCFSPPHDVAHAALDLEQLAGHVGAPIAGVLGHSFGGKVALAYAAKHPELEQIWVIDSVPGARPTRRGSEGTVLVLDVLQELGPRFASREAFVDSLQERGLIRDLATFLAMNLERQEDGRGFVLALDLDAIRAMLDDYFAQDLWRVVEHPPGDATLHLVVGGRSPLFDEDDMTRARRIASEEPRTKLHVIADAGHWVHADAPDALLALLTQAD